MYPTIQNIFLLQTGGTIGSAIHDGCIDVDPEKGDVLIQTYLKSASRLVDFEAADLGQPPIYHSERKPGAGPLVPDHRCPENRRF